MNNRAFCIIVFLLLPISTLLSAGRAVTIDDGNLRMFISNDGVFAYDTLSSPIAYGGLYYPKNDLRPMMSAAGIWVSGKKEGEWRVTCAGYGSEFVSGPVNWDGSPESIFPVYKITRGENQQANDDYQNWPTHLGAPVNAIGQPLIRGAQAVFALFNDTDVDKHNFKHSGTLPLGVEVQLYTYTWDNDYQVLDTILSQVIFLEYKVTNTTSEDIDSCIVTIWADVDVGAGHNDRIGCDSSYAAGYCYNDNGYDTEYGHSPPTVGLCLLEGELGSFNYYHPANKLNSLWKTVNLVRGLTIDGDRYINPATGEPTNYPYSGCPVTDSGWVNDISKDYRILMNLVPMTLKAGESQLLTIAVIVTQGGNVAQGTIRFYETTRLLHKLHDRIDLKPEVSIQPSEAFRFEGGQLYGRGWGGRYLSGGLDLAATYFDDTIIPDSLPSMEISFFGHPTQNGYRFCVENNGYSFQDFTSCPLSVLSTDHSIRYDYAFVDSDCDGTISGSDSRLEPIVILTTEYSAKIKPSLIENNGIGVPTQRLIMLHLDETVETAAGKKIIIDTEQLNGMFTQPKDTLRLSNTKVNQYRERSFIIYNPTRFAQEINITSDLPLEVTATPSRLLLGVEESRTFFLHVSPLDSGEIAANLDINSYSYHNCINKYAVVADADYAVVPGDANANGLFELDDILLMLGILFLDVEQQVSVRQLDANCDQIFDLTDFVILINVLFNQSVISCDSDG